ncbi:Globin-like host-protective antigen, partial [Trichinella zimbabwensis]
LLNVFQGFRIDKRIEFQERLLHKQHLTNNFIGTFCTQFSCSEFRKMVSIGILKDHLSKCTLNMENGGQLLANVFKANPELRKFYDVEDIDPDDTKKSRLIQQAGGNLLNSVTFMVNNYDNERSFKQEIKEQICDLREKGMKLEDARKLKTGFVNYVKSKLSQPMTAKEEKEWDMFFQRFFDALKQHGLQ